MGTPDRSVSGEAQDLCQKVSQEESVRLISDNYKGQESLIFLGQKPSALGWLRDSVVLNNRSLDSYPANVQNWQQQQNFKRCFKPGKF